MEDAKTIKKNAPVMSIHPAEDSYEYEMGLSGSSSSSTTSSQTPQRVTKGYFIFAIAVIGYALRHRYRRAKKKDGRYFSNDVRDEEAAEVAELVPSRGFRVSQER